MRRSDLIRLMRAANPGLPPRDVEELLAAFFGQIAKQLAAGGRVELRGFGAFTTRSRSHRLGRNPKSGASVEIAAKRVPHFRPAKGLRERVAVVTGS